MLILMSKKLMRQTQYNFFPEPYNLYGMFLKETYSHISYPFVKLDIIISNNRICFFHTYIPYYKKV